MVSRGGGRRSFRYLLILFLFLIILLSLNKVSALSFTINSPQNNSVYNSAKLILDVDTDVDARVWFNIDDGTNNSINYSRDIRDDDDKAENHRSFVSYRDIYKNLTSTFNITENATSARVYFYVGQFRGLHGAGANITVTVNGNSPIHFDTKDVVYSNGELNSYYYHWYYVDVPYNYLNSFNNTIILETTQGGAGDYYYIGIDTNNDYNRSFYGDDVPDNNETGEYMIYLGVYYTTNNLTTNGTYYFGFNDEGAKIINIYANDSDGNFNETSINVNFEQKKEVLILGGNATQYNIALRQFFNLYGIPVDIIDKSASIDEIYKYKITIDDKRFSLRNASEEYIIFDWIERGGKYLSNGYIRYSHLFLDKVFGQDTAYLGSADTLNNTIITDSSTHLTDDWGIINERLINSSSGFTLRHYNASSGYPNKTYVNWTNGTFTAPFYLSHNIGNGTIYAIVLDYSTFEIGSSVAYWSYAGESKWKLLLFDNFFREMNYSAKLQISPMKELRIDDALGEDSGVDSASVSNWTTFINKLRETGTIADLYIIASKIDNGNGDWIKEYLKNASDVLNYGIHGWVHGDFGNYTDSIPVEDAEANFTAAINNISDYFGNVKKIWVPPSHNYCINTTIAIANLNITFFSTVNDVRANQGLFEDTYRGLQFFNYSSGTYGLPWIEFIYQTDSNWGFYWNLSHIMNERIGQPMIFYTHGYQINKWYGLWSEHLVGDKKQPYHRWVGLDDIGEAVRALNEKTINDYVVNDTEAMMNFTLTRNVSGLDFLVYIPSGKYLIPYIDGQEHWAYYTDEWGRAHIMLPNMTSGEHIVRAVFNNSASNKPYLKYSVPFIKNITSYNESTKKFDVVLYGKGVNKTVTIIYNATENFNVTDNEYNFAWIINGVISSSNSSYLVSYDASTGMFNFSIPSMSEHEIILQESNDTTSPTPSFSCSPTSVTSGAEITCVCSATDAIDSNPSVSYTKNPPTSSTGTYTTTCTATDDAGNSATSSINYNVLSSGRSLGGGSSYTNTIVRDEKEFSEIGTIIKELKKKERVKIKIDDEEHYVGVAELTDTTATVEIFSTSQKTVFNVGDEKKFDVTEDNYYDIYVKLNSIAENKANLTIKSIYEEIPAEEKKIEKGGVEEAEEAKLWLLILGLVVVVAGVVLIIRYKKRRGK